VLDDPFSRPERVAFQLEVHHPSAPLPGQRGSPLFGKLRKQRVLPLNVAERTSIGRLSACFNRDVEIQTTELASRLCGMEQECQGGPMLSFESFTGQAGKPLGIYSIAMPSEPTGAKDE
jgi:hypothetical protein